MKREKEEADIIKKINYLVFLFKGNFDKSEPMNDLD